MGIRTRADVIAAKIKLYTEFLYCDEITASEEKFMAQLETDPDVENRLRKVRAGSGISEADFQIWKNKPTSRD